MNRKVTQKGAVFIESTIFVSILFAIILGGFSIVSGLRDRHRANEALYRSALKIMRITAERSNVSLPESLGIKCLVLKEIIEEELRKESITASEILILDPGTTNSVQQVLTVILPKNILLGDTKILLQVSTPNQVSPIDCSS